MEEAGAEVSKKDHMGNKELAYEINGFNKGDFWVLDIDSLKALNLKSVNLFLNREVSIIRYLILKK
jgi:ribosomal protein S6